MWGVHVDLVVLGVNIHEAEKFMAPRLLCQSIDPQEGEAILWASFIEISEVDSDLHFLFFFTRTELES